MEGMIECENMFMFHWRNSPGQGSDIFIIRVCCLCTKPISEPMLEYCQLDKFQWNFSRNSILFIEVNELRNVDCKMTDIFLRPQCAQCANVATLPMVSSSPHVWGIPHHTNRTLIRHLGPSTEQQAFVHWQQKNGESGSFKRLVNIAKHWVK